MRFAVEGEPETRAAHAAFLPVLASGAAAFPGETAVMCHHDFISRSLQVKKSGGRGLATLKSRRRVASCRMARHPCSGGSRVQPQGCEPCAPQAVAPRLPLDLHCRYPQPARRVIPAPPISRDQRETFRSLARQGTISASGNWKDSNPRPLAIQRDFLAHGAAPVPLEPLRERSAAELPCECRKREAAASLRICRAVGTG
jgi:hypothetical protein